MQIPVCRPVLSVGKAVPDMLLEERGLSQNQWAPLDEFVQIGVMDATAGLGGKGFPRGAARQLYLFLKFASKLLVF